MPDITHVLHEEYSKKGMVWTLVGDATTEDEFNTGFKVEQANGVEELSWEKLQEHLAVMQAEYDAKEYQRKREPEYPSIADQLDDIYHNGIDGWKKTIKITKDKYPK